MQQVDSTPMQSRLPPPMQIIPSPRAVTWKMRWSPTPTEKYLTMWSQAVS